jgi:hypothetical protein
MSEFTAAAFDAFDDVSATELLNTAATIPIWYRCYVFQHTIENDRHINQC